MAQTKHRARHIAYDGLVRLGLFFAVLGLLAPARAFAEDCIAQSETAQQERTDGHLRKARDLFKACSATECPQSVRSDCARSFDEVDRATPTIVVIARSRGQDVTNVRVVVDDEVIANKLTGDALAIDPGTHRLRLETAFGTSLVTREVVAHAAEKNRIIELEVTTPAPDADAPPPAPESGHTAGPWIVVSIGVAGVIAGGVMLAIGESDILKSKEGCATNTDGTLTCPTITTPDGQSRPSLDSTGNTLVNASIFAFVGGGLALAGGLLWHFLERPRAHTIAITPLVAPSLAGLSLDARF